MLLQRAQKWTYTHFDAMAEEHKKPSKPTEPQSKSVERSRFGINMDALPDLPPFSALIAMEAARLRGDKKAFPLLTREHKNHISDMLIDFCYSGTASGKALELYINAEVPTVSQRLGFGFHCLSVFAYPVADV